MDYQKEKPGSQPVTLDEVKKHVGVDFDEDDLLLISPLIDAATGYVEDMTGCKLINQTRIFVLDKWPEQDECRLPYGELQAVDSVTYRLQDGTINTFNSANYITDTRCIPGRIVLARNASWPSGDLHRVNPISIEFTTGYGLLPADVPERLKLAVKIMVAHWMENRELVISGTIFSSVPVSANAIIRQFRLYGQQ